MGQVKYVVTVQVAPIQIGNDTYVIGAIDDTNSGICVRPNVITMLLQRFRSTRRAVVAALHL